MWVASVTEEMNFKVDLILINLNLSSCVWPVACPASTVLEHYMVYRSFSK